MSRALKSARIFCLSSQVSRFVSRSFWDRISTTSRFVVIFATIENRIINDKSIIIICLDFIVKSPFKKFLFITKQGFFIFLDKLSNLIEVKKVLTKFRIAKLFFIVIERLYKKSWQSNINEAKL